MRNIWLVVYEGPQHFTESIQAACCLFCLLLKCHTIIIHINDGIWIITLQTANLMRLGKQTKLTIIQIKSEITSFGNFWVFFTMCHKILFKFSAFTT